MGLDSWSYEGDVQRATRGADLAPIRLYDAELAQLIAIGERGLVEQFPRVILAIRRIDRIWLFIVEEGVGQSITHIEIDSIPVVEVLRVSRDFFDGDAIYLGLTQRQRESIGIIAQGCARSVIRLVRENDGHNGRHNSDRDKELDEAEASAIYGRDQGGRRGPPKRPR